MNQPSLPPLPESYIRRMTDFLGSSAPAYFASLERPYCRGLRFNPRKPLSPDALAMADGITGEIPWWKDGRFITADSRTGAHPLHEAGAWYLQEPSAMIPVRLLAPKPGERILDLCAAPGGKSTQIADGLCGQGLLVCNEPVPSRAKILSRNIERMGVANSLVISAEPETLAERWPECFDAVLVDAPCSGEGMFRRHPETRLEWQPDSPVSCAARQRRILERAAEMVVPGGRMVYSTCTFNPEENENVILSFLQAHPEWELVPYTVPVGNGNQINAANSMAHFYPHEIQGEGHFAALLRRKGEGRSPYTFFHLPGMEFGQPTREEREAYEKFSGQFAPDEHLPEVNAKMGELLISSPMLPPLRGIRVLRAGINLGSLKGKAFIPDHALALALPSCANVQSIALTLNDAEKYLHGDTLSVLDEQAGFAVVTLSGLALGFGKCVQGVLKNHYPKGLRR